MKKCILSVLCSMVVGISCQKSVDTADTMMVMAPDTEAPSAPTGLTSASITATSFMLTWNAATDDVAVASYKIYTGDTAVGTTTETSFELVNLSAGTSYVCTVTALDAAGNASAKSSALTVTTISSANTGKAKVLVFTKTAGYNHNTESESVAMVNQIAATLDFEVVADTDGSEFDSQDTLNQFDVVFFSNTSGDFLNATQRAHVEQYAAQGGHFIANHAASDAYGHSTATTVSGNGKGVWDWYAEQVTGCSVRNNPNHTASNFDAAVTIENANNSFTTGMSFPWQDAEEWYYWEGGYIDASFINLLQVESTGNNSYDAARMTAQYYERPDGGISFYTSMGHSRNKYEDPSFVQLMQNVFAVMLD